MISPEVKLAVQQLYRESGMVFRPDELEAIEYADFGLNDFEREGLSLIIYDNNERYCAKELVLLPEQICPEHRHPERNGQPGKQETFRCRKGSVDLFVEGPESGGRDQVPKGKESVYTSSTIFIWNQDSSLLLVPIQNTGLRQGLKERLSRNFLLLAMMPAIYLRILIFDVWNHKKEVKLHGICARD